MRLFSTAFVAAILLCGSFSAMAQDTIKAEDVPKNAEVMILDNPYKEQIRTQAEKLANSFDEAEAQNFILLNQGFGFIRSITIAKDSVADAVKACRKNNPEMADDIKDRFKTWDDEIDSALKIQRKNYKEALDKPHFNNPKDVKSYLDLVDKAAKHAEDNIDKRIVTDKVACEKLLNSMDETQSVILQSLNTLQWPQVSSEAE
jgi:phosphate uptake regulator